MRKIPLFSGLSEALMAALASRAHDWRYWEIEESFSIAPVRNECDELTVCLRLERSRGGTFECVLPRDQSSPFEAVDQLIANAASAPVTSRYETLDWHRTKPDSPVIFFNDRDGQWSPPASPATGQTLKIIQAKNSKGYFFQSVTPVR